MHIKSMNVFAVFGLKDKGDRQTDRHRHRQMSRDRETDRQAGVGADGRGSICGWSVTSLATGRQSIDLSLPIVK